MKPLSEKGHAMTIDHEMGDTTPPPFKAGSPKQAYRLELITEDDEGLTMLIPTGMDVHPKYPQLRIRYWEAHRCHVEIANTCAKANVPTPCGYVVLDSKTSSTIGVGAYRSDDSPHDRAWIDVWLFEVFCGQDPPVVARIGLTFGALGQEQIEEIKKRTGAKMFAVAAQKQSV
jgi:hypothetical protein